MTDQAVRSAADHLDLADLERRIKTIFIVSVGNLVEWYDFYAYTALGVGLPYAITVSLFGGTAPAIALYFKSLGHEDWFCCYLSGMICLSLIICSTMRDTRHESAMRRHE